MTNCPKCGSPMHDKAELCMQCGYRVKHTTTTYVNKNYTENEPKNNITTNSKVVTGKSVVAQISSGDTNDVITANLQISKTLSVKTVRFIFTLLWGFIGSYIINHSSLKPKGWKSRTTAYFFWGILTFGIYSLASSICNFVFDENQQSNMGYLKE